MLFTLIGTFVVIIPFAEGVVVAADSRSMESGTASTATTLMVPAGPNRTVVAVTGLVEAGRAKGPFEEGVKDLDIGSAVLSFLEQKNKPLPDIEMAELLRHCAAAFRRFAERRKEVLKEYAGRDVFNVVLASYDPDKRIAHIRHIAVGVAPNLELVGFIKRGADTSTERDRSFAATFGKTKNLEAGFQSERARKFRSELPYAQNLSQDQAADIAADVVKGVSEAEATDRLNPLGSTVGGPVNIVVIDSAPEPRKL